MSYWFPDKAGLSAAALKYLACLFMLVDHIGLLLLPQCLPLRTIGRLAFPVFAFMLANGYLHTSNYAKYLLRLVLFAVGFQWFYGLIIANGRLSIFATLALGLLAIRCGDELRKRFPEPYGTALCLLAGALFCYLGWLIKVDYDWYGIALIYTAWLFYDSFKLMALVWILINLVYSLPQVFALDSQFYAVAALLLLGFYDGSRGKGNRWFFYVFYCAHLLLLYLIQICST